MLTALAVVFVAELGDKTQLLLLALAARHRAGPVIGGLLLGYGTTTVLGVLVGAAVGNALPTTVVQVGSGLAFLGFAVWTLLGDDHDEDEGDQPAEQPHAVLLALSIAGALIIAELGDKSQLATAALATEGSPVAVAVGALAGILAAGGAGVLAGRLLGDRLDPRLLRWGSAALFTAVGAVMLVRAL